MKDGRKKLRLVMQILLACLGLISGWGIAGFILSKQAVFELGMKIAIRSVTALVFGVIFCSLNRPVTALVVKSARLIKSSIIQKPLYKTAATVLGIAIGVMLGILSAELVSLFTASWEIQLIVSFVVAASTAYVGYLVCARWLKGEEEAASVPAETEYHGYVLSYGAFFTDKLNYFTQLANGPILLTGRTLNRLISLSEDDAEAKAALERYMALSSLGAIRIVDLGDEKTETEQILFLARSRLLKVITALPGEIEAEGIKILPLSEL